MANKSVVASHETSIPTVKKTPGLNLEFLLPPLSASESGPPVPADVFVSPVSVFSDTRSTDPPNGPKAASPVVANSTSYNFVASDASSLCVILNVGPKDAPNPNLGFP